MSKFFHLFVIICIFHYNHSQKEPTTYLNFPPYMVDYWFSLDEGIELNTIITKTRMVNEVIADSGCVGIEIYNDTIDADGYYDGKVLIYNRVSACYKCFEIFHRTLNIMQYKQTQCLSTYMDMKQICSSITPQSNILTMFRINIKTVNCKTTWEGTFSFTYEVDFGGGSICNSPRSAVVACQEPGSVYVDNQVFTMYFGKCPDVATSQNLKIRFQCMGTWYEGMNIYSAFANIGEYKYRDRFRCMLTRLDQQYSDNTKYYALSRWAECSVLKSPYEGPIRLRMWPAYIGNLGANVYGTQLVNPSCNFPRNFAGTWFTTAEFDSEVRINATHIYFKTKIDQFTYRESVFACQQNRDGRYLVTAVTVGRCEIDYICFAFQPRHQNIIRWRMSKPYRLSPAQQAAPGAMDYIFRQACTWVAFTLNRDDTNWRYNTFILNPPVPVTCPIGGRYNFTQVGAASEKYVTRIRGITQRPRHMIDCHEYIATLMSCDMYPKWLYVDAEYCETMDHTGKPISEYDQPDRQLFCAGYWIEDMKSYMITYDMEDAVSKFRCWVYDRRDWRDLYMSRAIKAICPPNQTPYSTGPNQGASLGLILKEKERLWDNCPQRYSTGQNPYAHILEIFVLNSATTHYYLPISNVFYLTNSLYSVFILFKLLR